MEKYNGGSMRKFSAVPLIVSALTLVGCSPLDSGDFSSGNLDACKGVLVQVNYGILSDDIVSECVEFESDSALASDVLSFAGVVTEGTEEYGDMVVCRVNSLPSDAEEIRVEEEEPYLETCEGMPPAFAYWALWHKASPASEWEYATEGVGTLMVSAGEALGLAFSSGADVVTPDIEP
jgi:hypothetical protein